MQVRWNFKGMVRVTEKMCLRRYNRRGRRKYSRFHNDRYDSVNDSSRVGRRKLAFSDRRRKFPIKRWPKCVREPFMGIPKIVLDRAAHRGPFA